MKQEQVLTDRKDWIVPLRVLAAMAIVLIHVVAGGTSGSGGGLTGARLAVDEVVVPVLTRWAVPCFLMISGALLLRPQKEVGLHKICRYLLRMVIVLAVFGFGFCILESVTENGYRFSGTVILSALQNLIAGKSWDHMWYVYMMIGLYILTPVLRSFTKAADGKTMLFMLIMLFAFTIALPTVSKFFHVEIYNFVPIATYCVFYYLLGYALSVWKLQTPVKWLLLLGGMLGFIGMLLLRLWGADVSIAGDNGFVALYSTGLFSLCIDNRSLGRLAKYRLVRSLSQCAFGIYLIHPLFLNILYKVFGIYPDILPVGVGEFLFWLAAFLAAYLVIFAVCQIPFVRKVLM